MALVATAVGPDHFCRCRFCSRVPHELFVRQMTDFRPVGC